jgi:hypothetical protein
VSAVGPLRVRSTRCDSVQDPPSSELTRGYVVLESILLSRRMSVARADFRSRATTSLCAILAARTESNT